jgi:hypothetical protein
MRKILVPIAVRHQRQRSRRHAQNIRNILVTIAVAAALLLTFRFLGEQHWLTGEDLTTIAATKLNANLEFDVLRGSSSIRRVTDRSTGAQGYFLLSRRLSEGEKLTGPLRMAPCDDILPRWIPVFPKARNVVCVVVSVNEGERRFASFIVAAEDLKEASDFYIAALKDLGTGAHVLSKSPGVDFRGGYSVWSHSETGKRVMIQYFTGDWDFSPSHLPLVVVDFSEPIAADAETLTAVFDAYNTAVKSAKADNLEPALALRTDEYRERGAHQGKRNPQAREKALEEMRFLVPLIYSVESTAIDVEVAALALLADLKIDMPGHPKHGQTVRQTMWVDFAVEKGAWKIGGVMLAPDPAQIKRSPDTTFDPNKSNYDLAKRVSLKGRIVRVAFETDHTLVAMLMLDEEHLAYMDGRAALEANGFKTARLMPPRLVEVEGHPHRTNKFKTGAGGFTLR